MKPLPLLTKQVMTFQSEDPIHDKNHLFAHKLQASNEKESKQKVQQIGSLTSDPINHEKYSLPKYFTVTKDTQMMNKTLKMNSSEVTNPVWNDHSFS